MNAEKFVEEFCAEKFYARWELIKLLKDYEKAKQADKDFWREEFKQEKTDSLTVDQFLKRQRIKSRKIAKFKP
jgi:hypothetical protein